MVLRMLGMAAVAGALFAVTDGTVVTRAANGGETCHAGWLCSEVVPPEYRRYEYLHAEKTTHHFFAMMVDYR